MLKQEYDNALDYDNVYPTNVIPHKVQVQALSRVSQHACDKMHM